MIREYDFLNTIYMRFIFCVYSMCHDASSSLYILGIRYFIFFFSKKSPFVLYYFISHHKNIFSSVMMNFVVVACKRAYHLSKKDEEILFLYTGLLWKFKNSNVSTYTVYVYVDWICGSGMHVLFSYTLLYQTLDFVVQIIS